MDITDKRILDLLAQSANMTATEIGRQVGLSVRPITMIFYISFTCKF